MSTLPGIVSKGEKGKTKYQSIDINSLYRSSRGESLEQHQQKNTVPRKHGMQSLGKVPSARRPPANLPSLRSETSSSDPAVSLVPSGGSGWATTKETAPTTSTVTTANTPSDNTTTNSSPAQCTTGPTPASLSSQQHPPLPGQQSSTQSPHPSEAGNKSSWSAIMSRSGDAGGGPTGQQPPQNRENAQYGPGPSLRPQSEGSWIQGGSRIPAGQGAGAAVGVAGSGNIQAAQGPPLGRGGPPLGPTEGPPGGRPNSGPSPGTVMVPAGQHAGPPNDPNQQVGPNMHHYRGIIPPFMYRGNFPAGGNFQAQFPAGGPRPRFNYPPGREPPQQRPERDGRGGPPQQSVEEEIVPRPIIKEEDLSRMDDISRDAGWTASDDIDYNQKLAFSDDEADNDPAPSSSAHSGPPKTKPSDDVRKQESQDKHAHGLGHGHAHSHEDKHLHDDKELSQQLNARDHLKREDQKENVGPGSRNEPRGDMQSLRSWNNQGPVPRDYRGPPGPPPSNYPTPQQPPLRTPHTVRDEEELWNQRRREQGEKVASAVERARQRKEEEEKRFQEITKQAAAKKLQDLENKLKEKHKLKEDDHQHSGNESGGSKSGPASGPVIPVPEWEREREGRERSRTSSSEGVGAKDDIKAAGRGDSQSSSNQQSQSSSMKSGHPLSAPPRRTRADSDVSGPLEDDLGPSRPGSRVQPTPRPDERHRHTGGRYETSRKQGSDGGYYDDYAPRRSERADRYKDYEYDDRHSRDGRDSGSWADQHPDRRYDDKPEVRDARDGRDSRDLRDRDLRDKKDYDSYSKGPASQDSFDDQPPTSQHGRGDSSGPEWREERRDLRTHDDRSGSADNNRRSGSELTRSGDELQRSERPQRPDSRDSRASRESRGSLRAVDDDFHNNKSSRDSGSWAACNDFSDYEDNKKQQQHIFREELRDRDRDRDREGPPPPRDRRQPPGPVTKDKLDQEEIKRGVLTQLKRGEPLDKKESNKSVDQSADAKKDSNELAWNRAKLERTPEPRETKSTAWADAVSPTFEKEEEEKRMMMDSQHSNDDDKKLTQSIEKLSIDGGKRSAGSDLEIGHNDTDKDSLKDDKRDKNARNRASSSGSRGVRGAETRALRQWASGGGGTGSGTVSSGTGSGSANNGANTGNAGGSFNNSNAYGQRGWRGAEPSASRGRRAGGARSMGGRPGSAKSGTYERTDSELSGDELISGSTESSKDERRPPAARSPKPSAPKGEKEERNRNAASSRKEDQQQNQQQIPARGGDYQRENQRDNQRENQRDSQRDNQSRNDKRSERTSDFADVRGGSARSSREGFAPSGEPSRRGRGGFRNNRGSAGTTGSAAGGRMEGYGPPPSKSPFSSDRMDENSSKQQHSSTPTPSEHEDGGNATNQSESADDKIIAKQQALTAGITGRHAKSPNQLNAANHEGSGNVRGTKKEDSRSKRTRSGSRRGRGGGGAGSEQRSRGINNANNKNEIGNEDWETTSENSEEHADDRKHGGRSGKPFGSRGERRENANAVSNNTQQHSREARGNRENREQRGEKSSQKSSNAQSNRAPGAGEKGRNAQNAAERAGNRDNAQRNHHSGNIPPLMQNSQAQNGRPRNQGSANAGPINNMKSSIINKDTTVNRIDEIKLNDPNLVNQALNDINSKQSKDKRGGNVDMDVDSICIDDGMNTGDDKIDADGFQEVRSKKNVKDSSRQQQKEDQQQGSKSGRRDRDKDRGDRDRSKSKTNGPQSQQQQGQQQGQNIPPLLGQPIGQAGAGAPPKQYERNASRQKLAPRFQKQRLAKQQQQQAGGNESSDSATGKAQNQQANTIKDAPGGVAPPPTVNAWDKPFTGGSSSRSPPSPAAAAVPADIQPMSSLTGQNSAATEHEAAGHTDSQQQTGASTGNSQRNSPNCDKVSSGKLAQVKEAGGPGQDKGGQDSSSPPVQTLIFENTNYSKNTKNSVGSAGDMAIKSKYSNHIKAQSRDKRASDIEDDNAQLQHQQQSLAVAFSSKPNELMKDKLSQQQQEPIQMPLSFNNKEDNADMKLDFTFDSDLSQLTEDKSKSLGMPRSMHITGGQSTISPSTAELNLKIASVKKVWENAPPMPTVVEHEVDGNVVSTASSFPQAFESNDVDDGYSAHQQYNQGNMKNEITTSTNVCKLVPPQVKPQQQSSGGGGAQPGSSVPGPSPIGPGQSPIGHPPASLQGPLSPPPFNSTGQPSHMNYQEFAQYPGSQPAQYGSMSAIPSPPAVLFNTGSGQLPAQAGGLYGAFQLDQSRSPFTQYSPYAASLQSSFNQQNMYLQQPPPPHAPNAPTPDIYQNNLSQYRLTATAAPPFGQNQQLSNNPNTVLISSSSNSLMSATVKPSSQPIGAIGTKAAHFQAPSAPPQASQLTYIPYDPNQVLGVSGSYMSNSQLVQRPGPNVQPSANNYYSATSADVFSGSQTGFYQPGGAAQQTGAHYSLQGFSQHSQSLATGNAPPVGLQNFGSQFLSGSGLQIAAAAAAQQYRNPTGGLPGPANAAATFLSKHQQQEQPRQLKSPSGNQQDVIASVFSSTSPKSRKQQSSSQQPQPSPTQHHKFQQYQGVSQSALVSSYPNYQQNVRGMGGMPPRGGIQPSQQRYPPPIQRPVVPFPPGPNPNNSQQGQQQQNCMPNQQQQSQMNRHRPNIHQQQQQQRNMKMQQQYYSGQSNVKMDSNDKVDSHNDKISDNAGNQSSGNKSNANPPESDNKEEVSQQNE